MKNSLKYLLVVLVIGITGGFFYWQYNKKKIIKNSIQKAIAKKSDSLYYLHYDSSFIDEINGNATFFNVVLQSDSAQKQLLNRTDSLPNALYNISVKQVLVSGVDVAGFIDKVDIEAHKILLLRPVIQIINTGADNPKPFTLNDTLALYEKILGKFKSIKADTIQVSNGTLLITDKSGKAQTSLENININLNRFLIDSTKNYESIISYFIKDVRATVENIQLPASKNNTRFNLEKVDYNAAQKSLHITAIKQYQVNNMNAVIDLKNIQVNELNTDAFIVLQRLNAGKITCDGGLITIYKKASSKNAIKGDQAMELSSDIIDQGQIGGISLGKTKVIIIDKSNPSEKPFVLTNVVFNADKIPNINDQTTLNNLINNAQWQLSADGFSFNTDDGLYKMDLGNFVVNNVNSSIQLAHFHLKPLLTEQQFVSKSRVQRDQFNLSFNSVNLSGVNIKELISNKKIEVDQVSLRPVIKVFNDRTLPFDTASKLGKYPHQALLKLDIPVYIKTLKILNGSVAYRERGLKSGKIGNVFFSNLNATVSNITNMPERIKQDALLKLTARASFLGKGALSTQWELPLNTTNGAFKIRGEMGSMQAVALNSITEPLALASIKQGEIDKLVFNENGVNTKATGDVLFLYRNLKVNLLKKDENDAELKKKGFMSFLANTLIKNENTSTINHKKVDFDRDMSKSFFNLVWKTVFAGVKSTVIGKKEKE